MDFISSTNGNLRTRFSYILDNGRSLNVDKTFRSHPTSNMSSGQWVYTLYYVPNYADIAENNKTGKTNNVPVIKHSVPSETSSKGPGKQTR